MTPDHEDSMVHQTAAKTSLPGDPGMPPRTSVKRLSPLAGLLDAR